MRYSPDLRTLAAASHDTMIDLYDTTDNRYMRLHRCQGHSSTVYHLDWSVDSKMLQSQCQAPARVPRPCTSPVCLARVPRLGVL